MTNDYICTYIGTVKETIPKNKYEILYIKSIQLLRNKIKLNKYKIKIMNNIMEQSSNSQFAVLSNGLIIKFSNIVGIQPNTSNKDEFYVHTVTSQYYKINAIDYNYLKLILSEEPKMFYTFTSGLIVRNDYVIGIQATDKDGEYYVHTTTPQYYKINKSDYSQFIGDNFTFNTSDPVETL